LAGGLNLYGYAGGDPINFSDPFGLDCLGPDGQRRPCLVILNGATAPNSSLMRSLLTFADQLERDITFNGPRSGTRSSSQNAGVNGATQSPHLAGEGADIHVAGMSNLELAHKAAESGLFTGVGHYEDSKHLGAKGFGPHAHVDNKNRRTNGVVTWQVDENAVKRSGLPPK
jgi:hypothetical protein